MEGGPRICRAVALGSGPRSADGEAAVSRDGSGVGRGLLCPQGKEPSVRQLALLHFRNAITLSVKLEDALARTHARVPPAIVQMLLVLQVRGAARRPLGMRPGLPDAEPEARIWVHGTRQWGDCQEKPVRREGSRRSPEGVGGEMGVQEKAGVSLIPWGDQECGRAQRCPQRAGTMPSHPVPVSRRGCCPPPHSGSRHVRAVLGRGQPHAVGSLAPSSQG